MTVRTTILGGTDWNNEQVTDTDLNDSVSRAATQILSVHNITSAAITTATVVGSHIFTPYADVLLVHFQAFVEPGNGGEAIGSMFAYPVGGVTPIATHWHYHTDAGETDNITYSGYNVFISGTHYTLGNETTINVATDNGTGNVTYYSSYVQGQYR